MGQPVLRSVGGRILTKNHIGPTRLSVAFYILGNPSDFTALSGPLDLGAGARADANFNTSSYLGCVGALQLGLLTVRK